MKPALQQLQEGMLSCIRNTSNNNISFINSSLLKTTHLTPERSLAIYQYGYKARLLECLRADYPVLKALLGEALFELFALEYLETYPSTSYSLFQLGERFPDFMQDSCPDISRLTESKQARYQLPIELARLERLRVNAMRSPGVENHTQHEPDYCCLEQLKQLRPKTPATLGLMRSVHNLPDYYQALHGSKDETETTPTAELIPSCIAVSRSNYRLSIHTLGSWQYAWLRELQMQQPDNDASLAQLTEKISHQTEVTQEYLYAHLPLWLPLAVARGYLYF